MTDVLGRILAHAAADPDRPAVKDPTRELTFADLEAEIATLAGGLAAVGVGDGDRVALHLPNSTDFVVAALACLWVGAIFVPLAVGDPDARLATVLDDAGPAAVLSATPADEQPAALRRHGARDLAAVRRAGAGPVERIAARGDRPSYAIYTSGTTGTPKGVLIATAAFAAAVADAADALGLGPTTQTLCVSAFHFDGSFATLFPTLSVGGRVVIVPRDALLFPRTFVNTVLREAITYTGFSPSYLRVLLASPHLAKLAAVPLVIGLGGEAASAADLLALWEVMPAARVLNRYGPTETTIAVTHCELSAELVGSGAPIPIGRPHPGVTFRLVDPDGHLVDDGRVGELWIGGDQLMVGYWGAPGLTAAVLRDDVVPGELLYRTGDLVRRSPDGTYVYVDRADRVVKRSGVRISLVELGEALRAVPSVTAATCTLFDDGGVDGIVAFVVVGDAVGPDELRRATLAHLPASMVPDRYELVDTLPATLSGKVDHRALLSAAGLTPPRR